MDMKDILGALAPAMSRDNAAEDDQYTEDGLRICAKCGERKQTWFEVKGLIARNKVPCMCRCEREKLEAEEAARKQEEQYRLIQQYRNRGLTDEQYKACTFDADDGTDEEASTTCRRYVERWQRMQESNTGLILWGDVGGGKTFLAACVANALIDKGIPATMTTIPRLVAAITKDFGKDREEVLYMVANAPLLVLDDVGTERNTEYNNEQVYEIINARYKAKKPLIITTNLTMTEMKSETDEAKKRIYDRIVEMCPYPQKVTSTGRRQRIAKSKYEAAKELLGL